MAIEIVDFPMQNGDFPWQNVSSPEGNYENSPCLLGRSLIYMAIFNNSFLDVYQAGQFLF